MARSAQKVESLANEEGMADAMGVVLGRADEQGTVEWADVRADLTSGQWGRLIQTGILVDAGSGDGFVVDDPDAVRAAVGEEKVKTSASGASATSSPSGGSGSAASATAGDDAEETTWSTYDKAAAVGAIGMFAGYTFAPVRNVIGGSLDLVLGPLGQLLPFYMVILVLAMFTGLYSTLLQANLMNTEKMGEYQQRMKDIQARRKDAKERGDDAEVQAIQEEQMEAMGDQLGMFKEQFRPMVWIMLLTIPVFLWMYWKIGARGGVSHGLGDALVVLPLVGEVGWTAGILGPIQAWILWYFLCSMGFTQIIRKSLNIQTTPHRLIASTRRVEDEPTPTNRSEVNEKAIETEPFLSAARPHPACSLTVSGPPGSGKSTTAAGLADALDYEHVSGGDIFRSVAAERGLSALELNKRAEEEGEIDRELDRRQRELAEERENVVLESRLAGWMAAEHADLKIWLDAPLDTRITRIADREGKSVGEAREETVARADSEALRYREYYGIDISDLSIYDLVVNTARWSAEGVPAVVRTAVETYDPASDEGGVAFEADYGL